MAEHLTGKQKLFVEEYLVDLNASRAAIRAGYQGKWAGNCGRRNLQNPHVRAAIEKAQAPRLAELDLDARRVLAELTKIAQANVLDYMRIDRDREPIVDFKRLDRARASALSEVVVEELKPVDGAARRRVRFRLHDKLASRQAGQAFRPLPGAHLPGDRRRRHARASTRHAPGGARHPRHPRDGAVGRGWGRRGGGRGWGVMGESNARALRLDRDETGHDTHQDSLPSVPALSGDERCGSIAMRLDTTLTKTLFRPSLP